VSSPIDVLGIGNAIVDVVSQTTDAFLSEHEVPKGTMSLIDEARARALYDAMGPGMEVSGGSAANTIAGVAQLGGQGAYIGKVRDDQLGDVFAHDIKSIGVQFTTDKATDGPATARCLVLVTDDAQRSMNTFLGACTKLGPDDVDRDQVKAAKVTYLEGYLWDPDEAKEAFRKAMTIAHDAGNEVSLTLSDPFCVDRHRDEFRQLVEDQVDILFANEEEIKSLYQVDTFDDALQLVRGHCRVAALTRSEKGAVIVSGDEVHVIDAAPVDKLLDTTGAGDLFAAGMLHGLTHGYELADAGRLGAACAGVIIQQYGARYEGDLKAVLAEHGVLK
jgi:sugar/nucleoside kinase (ribokinase family)